VAINQTIGAAMMANAVGHRRRPGAQVTPLDAIGDKKSSLPWWESQAWARKFMAATS
jgi:hypothetical protein